LKIYKYAQIQKKQPVKAIPKKRYEILATGRFKKDLRIVMKRGYNIKLLQEVVSLLAAGNPLPEKYKDHLLFKQMEGKTGKYSSSSELLLANPCIIY
jgi:addiction module RelE/StbE family toxin